MHVKYIVYSIKPDEMPCVDIWKTKGDLLHPVYAAEHEISVSSISSMGDLYFNPLKKRWELDHYPMTDGLPALSFSEIRNRRQIIKRDKALVQKKIHESAFLNDENLQKQCQKLSLIKRFFQHD